MIAIVSFALLGVMALVSDFLRLQKWLVAVVMVLLAALGIYLSLVPAVSETILGMATWTPWAQQMSAILAGMTLLYFLGFHRFYQNERWVTDYTALLLFSIGGIVALFCFADLTLLFIGIEVLSIPVYILAGAHKINKAGNEAAYKYFIFGSFASAFLLLGIAFLFGATGSFVMQDIIAGRDKDPLLWQAGTILIFTALLFKTAAVPFHFWSPDVYEGAPTPVTAYMATILKLGTFAAFAVFYAQVNAYLLPEIQLGLAGVSGLTLLVANLMATVQTNAKRLLAFSSISHSGFMLTGIVSQASMEQLAYYLVVYGIASMTAFKVLNSLPENASNAQYRGLLYQRPQAAVALILSLLSMAGLPPLSGFLAKYNVLAAAVKNDYIVLAIIGVLASMLAIYYYLSIIIQACRKTEPGETVLTETPELSDAIYYGFVTIALIAFLVVPF